MNKLYKVNKVSVKQIPAKAELQELHCLQITASNKGTNKHLIQQAAFWMSNEMSEKQREPSKRLITQKSEASSDL